MSVYGYYHNLTGRQKAIYRKSDEIAFVALKNAEILTPHIGQLEILLQQEDKSGIQKNLQLISKELTTQLNVPDLKVKVLAVRPSHDWGELHGLYEPIEKNSKACISLWMRTARHKKIVAFRTFLRTYLHELCHHLDYELFKLDDSFHTEGFFKRESGLFKQLVKS